MSYNTFRLDNNHILNNNHTKTTKNIKTLEIYSSVLFLIITAKVKIFNHTAHN